MGNLAKQLGNNQAARYIFFGGCTTLVNVCCYALFRRVFGMDITIANFCSISLAILFAYVVNKVFVFESKKHTTREVLTEFAQFVSARLLTMFIEIFGTVLMSAVWGMNDMVAKLLIQVVVLVLNYIFSKIYVFSKKEKKVLTRQEVEWKKRRMICCLCGFLIPVVTVSIGFIANGAWPFGDRGMLIIDSLHQYLPFFTEFHDKLTESESLLYSFGGGLGFNFWATYAYYLASPINFLITLFPRVHVMEAMQVFIVLKIGLCGFTFTYYLTQRDKGRTWLPLMFGPMFALSSFIIGYYFNIMWLDSIAMLPLIMMGIERIVRKESASMFCLALSYGLYCNYYIGFMLCLFSCLYFLVQWAAEEKFSVQDFFMTGFRFAWYALLAGGMAAIVLLPAYRALGITESMENTFPSTWKFFVNDLSQLTSQFAFVEPINIANNQIGVNGFCGVLTLILAPLYALDHKRTRKERISKLVLLGILALSFNLNVLNYIWHGLHTQNGLPNRFAFIYIILLLTLCYDVLCDLKELSVRRVAVSCIPALAFAVGSMATGFGEREMYTYVITVALLVVYSGFLIGYASGHLKTMLLRTGVITLCLIEMVSYGIFGTVMNGSTGRSTYTNEQVAYQELMARMGDTDFFRSEIDSTRMRNENMFLGANGVVLFSSTMPAATVDLCKSLGMEARMNKNGYKGLTKLVNDMFGVRYLVSTEPGSQLYQMKEKAWEDPLTLYENPDALSLGFVVNPQVVHWDISYGSHFEVQEAFVNLATGDWLPYTLTQDIPMEEGPAYTIHIPAGKQVYMEIPKAVEKLTLNTPDYTKTYNKYNDHLYNIGSFDEDTKGSVQVEFKEGQQGPVTARIYTCEISDYERVHERLAANQLTNVKVDANRVTASLDTDKTGVLMMTIPYDKGWKVWLDGEEVKTYTIGKALTGIDVQKGHHEISMQYTPDGLWLGSLLTLVCIGLYVMTGYLERKRG